MFNDKTNTGSALTKNRFTIKKYGIYPIFAIKNSKKFIELISSKKDVFFNCKHLTMTCKENHYIYI